MRIIVIGILIVLGMKSFAQSALENGTYLMAGIGLNNKKTKALDYSESVVPNIKFGKIYYFGEEGSKSNFAFNWNIIDASLHFYTFKDLDAAIEAGMRAGFTYSVAFKNNSIDFSAVFGPTIQLASMHDVGIGNMGYLFISLAASPNIQWRINNKYIIGSSYTISQSVSGSGDFSSKLVTSNFGGLTSKSLNILFGLYLNR